MIHAASLRPYQQPVSKFTTVDEHMSAANTQAKDE
jgi:hypothetical protein